jgi:hypothetical protein
VNVVAVVLAPASGFQAVEVRGLAAVVDDTVANGRDAVLRHAAAVDRVFATSQAVLPARAGTRLPDEPAVRAWLEREHDVLERALDRVRGCAEIALTWHADATHSLPATSGTDYLRALAVRSAGAAGARDQLELVRELPEVSGVRTLGDSMTVVKASVLVLREHAESVRDHLATMGSPSGSWTANGPFPPYSFVDEDWS